MFRLTQRPINITLQSFFLLLLASLHFTQAAVSFLLPDPAPCPQSAAPEGHPLQTEERVCAGCHLKERLRNAGFCDVEKRRLHYFQIHCGKAQRACQKHRSREPLECVLAAGGNKRWSAAPSWCFSACAKAKSNQAAVSNNRRHLSHSASPWGLQLQQPGHPGCEDGPAP